MEQCSNLLITTVQIRETDAEVEKVMFQNFQNTTLYVFNGFAHCTQKECPTYVNTPKPFYSSHPSMSIHYNICRDLKASIFMWISGKGQLSPSKKHEKRHGHCFRGAFLYLL